MHELLDLARQLEGAPRHASVHAAGVVIAPSPVWEHVPLQKMQDGSVVTQFPMTTLEELGLLKMDFLGLRTLTVVAEARRLAEEEGAKVPAMADLPPDDRRTFAMLSSGDTWGVFQLESAGMTDMLREMKPGHVEDIIAAVSLYRPGPMENIPLFVEAKQERAAELSPSGSRADTQRHLWRDHLPGAGHAGRGHDRGLQPWRGRPPASRDAARRSVNCSNRSATISSGARSRTDTPTRWAWTSSS